MILIPDQFDPTARWYCFERLHMTPAVFITELAGPPLVDRFSYEFVQGSLSELYQCATDLTQIDLF